MKKSIFNASDLVTIVKVEKENQSVFNLLSRVVYNDPMRSYFRAIRYFPDDRKMVSTDGKRLIIVDCEKLPASLMVNIPHKDAWLSYEKGFLSVYDATSLGVYYPNYKRVIPDDNYMVTNGNEYIFIEKHTKNSNFSSEQIAAFSVPLFFRDHENIMINLGFIKDLYGMIYKVKINAAEEIRAEKPVVFFNDLVTAVVMPIRPPAYFPEFYSCDTRPESEKAAESVSEHIA